MALRAARAFFIFACLSLALWYGLKIEPAQKGEAVADPAAVESAYREIALAIDSGKGDSVFLEVRKRSEKGPYQAAAYFFLGELAYGEGSYQQAMAHYRKAVEKGPYLADKNAPLGASGKILAKIDALRNGPWKGQKPQGTADLSYLLRRLSGGCE